MLLNVYTLYDVKSETYGLPYFAVNDAIAMRTCYDGCLMADSTVSRHPEDFTIYRLGYYDDSTGVITCSQRVHVVDVVSLIPKEVADES